MSSFPKTAPGPLDPVPFHIPPAFHTTLTNGLRIVIFEEDRLPIVSYRMAFFSGDAHDPADLVGQTSALTSMITEGTEKYSSRELAEKVERLGASLSANSSDDFTIISASALSMYGSEILDLIAEVLFRPTFPDEELDLYKRNTLENLKFQRSQPNFLANEQTARLIFGKHPYSVVSPKPADIENLTRESLISARERIFLPNNAVLVVVGAVDKADLLIEAEEHFGDWESGDRHIHSFENPPNRDRRSLTVVDRPGSAQANIVLANLAIPRHHPDYFAAFVMNQILGAGASSRVFMNLREEKGYTYGAYTRLDAKRMAGDFEATAEVRTAVTGDSLKEFFYELTRIRDEKVADSELADAKSFLTGVFPIRAETQEGLTGLIMNQLLYDLPSDYLQTYRDEIEKVTAEDVLRAANTYISPGELAMIIVGDAAEILPQVREYTDEIEVFDTDGRAVDLDKYRSQPDEPAADVAGAWKLSLDFQGQQVPVELLLEQDGALVSGQLKTMLGDGQIADGKVSGKSVSASAATDIQGQTVEFIIRAEVDGERIAGTIESPMIPDALKFEGERGPRPEAQTG